MPRPELSMQDEKMMGKRYSCERQGRDLRSVERFKEFEEI